MFCLNPNHPRILGDNLYYIIFSFISPRRIREFQPTFCNIRTLSPTGTETVFILPQMLSRVVLLLFLVCGPGSYGFRSLTTRDVRRTSFELNQKRDYSVSSKTTLKTGYKPPSSSNGVSKFLSGAMSAVKKTVVDAVHSIEHAVDSVTHPETTPMAEPSQSTQPALESAPIAVSSPIAPSEPVASLEPPAPAG